MRNKNVFILLSFLHLMSSDTFCMLGELKYQGYMQPNDPEIATARKDLNADLFSLELFTKHSVKICRHPKPEEYSSDVRCSIYATKKITGLHFNCFAVNKEEHWTMGLQILFKQLQTPKKGCLVVWMNNKQVIQHFGYLISNPDSVQDWKNLIVKHKLGNGPIVESSLFNIPDDYGPTVLFFDLRKKYINQSALFELQKSINLKIKLSEPKQKQANTLYGGLVIGTGIIFGYLYGGSAVFTGIIFGHILFQTLFY